MHPDDVFTLRSAGDAQPSPDGQRIAYAVTDLDRGTDQARSSIWLVSADGDTPRRVTSPTFSSSEPRWSPDGRMLAFMSTRERGPQIWLHRLGGSAPQPLTDVPGGVTGPPVWSPDGQRIVFTARASSAPPTNAAAPRVIRRLRYLLNGAGYIADAFWHVFVIRVGVDHPATAVRLTSGEWHHFSPAWSPDGTRITCITTRRDEWDTEWVWDVYVLDAEDGDAAPCCLTDSRGTCAAPAWSPDGRWIAYFANECPFTAYTRDYYLCLVPAAGGAARNVSRSLDRGCQVSQPPSNNEPPHWSADSSTVFFHVREGGFYHYYTYQLDADSLRRVLAARDLQEPVAGVVRQSADGRLLALAAARRLVPAPPLAAGSVPAGVDNTRHFSH